jgi:hypothetical protein
MMTHDERTAALERMHDASRTFYVAAVQIGNHPFIEFTGLMNEYIKACEEAHAQGIDFSDCNTHTGASLPLAKHMLLYINEKLECIFTGRVKYPNQKFDMGNRLLAIGLCASCTSHIRKGNKRDARFWCANCGDRWTPEEVTAARERFGR